MERKKNFYQRIMKRLKKVGYDISVEVTPILTPLGLKRKGSICKLKKYDERAREVRIAVQEILLKVEDARKKAEKSKLHLGVCT